MPRCPFTNWNHGYVGRPAGRPYMQIIKTKGILLKYD